MNKLEGRNLKVGWSRELHAMDRSEVPVRRSATNVRRVVRERDDLLWLADSVAYICMYIRKKWDRGLCGNDIYGKVGGTTRSAQ